MSWTNNQLHKFCLTAIESDILKYSMIIGAIARSKLYFEWKQFELSAENMVTYEACLEELSKKYKL